MKKSVIAIVIAVLAIGAIGWLVFGNSDDSDDNQTTTTTSDSSTADETVPETQDEQPIPESSEVNIQDMAFAPGTITVKKGTNVTWTNFDSVGHTVTPDNPTDEFKASGMLNNTDSYSVTFNTPGTYTYHCEPHPQMKGTVVVTE